MKRIFFILVALIGMATSVHAQRYCYVDSQYILDNIPEYKTAQAELDRLSIEWQNEVEAKFKKVEKRRQEFQAEAILLPEEIKRQREKEIADLEAAAIALQSRYFGVGGELFNKRTELIQPIQDRIFQAIQDVAKEKKYAFVFDKANQSNLLFADPKYNISDLVLRKMGITVKKK
ncbi:MAG TPA: OmpH family outer membrane protein [Crocinitomix sp.]|nr:OmpH family outer membrane protein [Crocinitomix sp.]